MGGVGRPSSAAFSATACGQSRLRLRRQPGAYPAGQVLGQAGEAQLALVHLDLAAQPAADFQPVGHALERNGFAQRELRPPRQGLHSFCHPVLMPVDEALDLPRRRPPRRGDDDFVPGPRQPQRQALDADLCGGW